MKNISRKQFLTGAIAGAAAVSMVGVSFAAEAAEAAAPDVVLEADVVIAGCGGAGLMAGLNLSRMGYKVIMLEKGASVAMSNFARCGGPAAANTKLQAEAGADVSVDKMFNYMYGCSRGSVNAALLYHCVANSGKAIDDMSELGIPMVVKDDTYGVGFRGRHMFMASGNGRVDPILNEISANGGEVYTGCPATSILMDEGKAVGMMAQSEELGLVQVNAKAVLVTTGGFQGNPDMIKKYFGNINCKSLGNDLSAGDGINMILEVGGTTDRNFCFLGNEGSASTTKIAGPIWSFAGGMNVANQNLAFGLYGGLLVDKTGKRFVNEKDIADFPLALGGEAFARAGKSYAIIDSATYEACAAEGIYSYMGKPENWQAGLALWVPMTPKAKEELPTAIEEGWAYTADSLKECAEYFGLTDLEETVASYNAMCEAGADTIFGKAPNFMRKIGEGPYYVFEYEAACWGTNGGIKIDQDCRVVGDEDEAIPGLYCAGVDNGSVYCAPYYLNEGASIGMALGSGVWAAKTIAKYIG